MSLVPAGDTVRILSLNRSAVKVTQLRLLGSNVSLEWMQSDEALEIDFSGIQTGANGFAVEVTCTKQPEKK
jgi:alpha-L-fucosidase